MLLRNFLLLFSLLFTQGAFAASARVNNSVLIQLGLLDFSSEPLEENRARPFFASPYSQGRFRGNKFIGETHKGWIVCYEISDNLNYKDLWSYPSPEGGLSTPPYITNDGVYLASKEGNLIKLSLTGDFIWSQNLVGVYIDGDMGLYQEHLFFETYGGTTYKIEAETGDNSWAYQVSQKNKAVVRTLSRPLFSSKNMYLLNSRGDVVSLNTDEGTLNWQFSPPHNSQGKFRSAVGEMTLVHQILYVARYDGYVFAVDTSTRKLLWDYDINTSVTAATMHKEENLFYIGDSEGKLHALDISTGKNTLPKGPDFGKTTLSHIVFHGKSLYVTGSQGKLFRVDTNSKAILESYDIKAQLLTPPIFFGQHLLLPSNRKETLFYVFGILGG